MNLTGCCRGFLSAFRMSILATCLLLLLIPVSFIIRLKYSEFLVIREQELVDANELLTICTNERLINNQFQGFRDACVKVVQVSQIDPREYAIKDVICLMLPFMQILDRDTSESVLDIILGSDKLIKGLVLFLAFYVIGHHFGLFQRQYNHPLILPYMNTNQQQHQEHSIQHNRHCKEKVQ